jgi:hypothetical protein
MIQDDHFPATKYWLNHNHPKYTFAYNLVREHQVAMQHQTVEEQVHSVYMTSLLASNRSRRLGGNTHQDEINAFKEHIRREEEDEPMQMRIDDLLGD